MSLFVILIYWTADPFIAITEVLKDPAGGETACPGGRSHEFVEFANFGIDTLYLDSLFLSDGETKDSVILFPAALPGHGGCLFDRRYVLPGQFAVILDRDYSESPAENRFSIAESTLVLTVGRYSLTGGLTETKGIILYKGTIGIIGDSLASFLDPGETASLERRLVQSPPAGIREGFSIIPTSILLGHREYSACPESLSLGSFEPIRQGWLAEYSLVKNNAENNALCSLSVCRMGQAVAPNMGWKIVNITSLSPAASGVLPSGPGPLFFFAEIPIDTVSYELVISDGGVDIVFDIDISTLNMPRSPIKINEIYPRSTSECPEWIELTNVSSMAINIKNWRFGTPDGLDTITAGNLILRPNDFLVITKDAALFNSRFYLDIPAVQPGHWQALDNYRDTVYLFGTLEDLPCETVYYDHSWFGEWENQSIERVSLDKDGLDNGSWVLGANSTPGQPNASVNWRSSERPSMNIGPIPFTPNNDGKDDLLCITLSLPATSKASLSIYGFDGRKIADIPEPVSERFCWDGKSSEGVPAPVGPIFVIAEIITNGKKEMIRKKGILWR